jgi:hypothetical protein
MSIELNPADALKMFEEQELGLPETEPKDEPKVETPPAAATEAESVQEPEVQREPEGIATKDGKHVIPYSVLQSERTRAAQAERDLQEARTQLAALQAAATDPKPTAKDGGADTPEVSKEDEDRLALLEEDFPTVAAELKATRELVKSLAAKLKPLETSTEEAAQQRAAETAMTVQEAIDSVPKLAHIQAASPEAFELAKQFDNTLRERADWAGKPMNERFAKVIELVESSIGEIKVPGHSPSAESKDPAALKAAAAAKVATAPKAVPTSLSQFPAGDPAAADEVAAVEQMSTAQLASKMARMTPAQLDAYFASL